MKQPSENAMYNAEYIHPDGVRPIRMANMREAGSWTKWHNLNEERVRQAPTEPGVVEIRAHGASDSAFVGSGVRVRGYIRRRLTNPERWMSPYENDLRLRGNAFEFRFAVAKSSAEARASRNDYIREYIQLTGILPRGNKQLPQGNKNP